MQVRVLNHKNGATRDCKIGDVFDVIQFSKKGTPDYHGFRCEYDSVAFKDPVGDIAVGWTSGPLADLEIV